MSGEIDLVDWADRMPGRLRRLVKASHDELRKLRKRARDAVARAAPRGRTGDLRRSIAERGEGPIAEVYSDDPAAAALETGEAIHGSPYLAVPLVAATRALSGPRSDPGLFVLKARSGLFLASRVGGAVELRWKLQATVHPRRSPFFLGAVDSARRDFPAHLSARFGQELTRG